jgi:hypothetical protein
MTALNDAFSQRRLLKFVENLRAETGQLPTLKDFAAAGFGDEAVKQALKLGLIEEFYVTLTQGTIVKAFKIKI